ncbi:4'-phosphopantetheinyl transferase family protein [Phytobacter sp. V91]|uniref:4'-phosphopantetheinyl transferase family protein n=1 Tax=Phytobacter sp. V91 TaxID=3369425 RepID=UPI003F6204FF
MATHFARGTLSGGCLVSTRLSQLCRDSARQLPEHQQSRFLASRALLAEMMFMLYGVGELPDIIIESSGRPKFSDPDLPHFSLASTGNMVGVAIATEGECGLNMELQRATRSFHSPYTQQGWQLTSNEQLWINNQNDPNEAQTQLSTLRQSVLQLINQMHNGHDLLQLLPGAGRLRVPQLAQVEVLCDAEDVLIWSVAATPAIESLKIWEFDSKNGWRYLPDVQTRANDPASRLMRFTSLPAEKTLTLN